MKPPLSAALLVILLSSAPTVGQESMKRLEMAVQSFPTTLDPHRVFYPPWNEIYRLVYETPVACAAEDRVLRLVPRLLATLPEVADDGRRVTLRFRRGARFQDDPCFPDGKGREIHAQDFMRVLYHHADPANASVYWNAYLAGRIEGLDELRTRAEKEGFFDYDARVKGIDVVDDQVLVLRFHGPYPQFTALLTMAWASVVPWEARRKYGDGLGQRPVGSGPYRFDPKNSTGSLKLFVRRDDYWRASEGGRAGPLPRNGGVRLHVLPDLAAQEKRFLVGDLSFLDLYPGNAERFCTPRGRLRRKNVPRKTKLLVSDRTWVHYIAFNMRNKILAKKTLRQALCLAVDRKRYVRDYYKGAAVLANHPVPPGLPLDTPTPPKRWAFGRYNLKKAKALLAEAGYPDGKGLPEFVLEAPDGGPLAQQDAEILKSSWARLGVKVQVRFHDSMEDFIDRARRGVQEITINYWFADYPDADNFFLMLASRSIPRVDARGDTPNMGFYSNPEYDRLYLESTTLAPGKERGRRYARMIQIIQEDCPWLFVAHQQLWTLVGPGVTGLSNRNPFAADAALINPGSK